MADKTPPKKGRPRGSGSFPWRAFFHQSTTPVFVLGGGRRLRYANPAWEKLTGTALADALGMVCSARRHSSPLAAALAPTPEVQCRQARHRPPCSTRARAGTQWWDIAFAPLAGAEGLYGIVGFITVVGESAPHAARKLPASLVALREKHGAHYSLDLFAGSSPAAERFQAQLRHAAQSSAPVWLLGEPGSGKETAAQDHSPCRPEPRPGIRGDRRRRPAAIPRRGPALRPRRLARVGARRDSLSQGARRAAARPATTTGRLLCRDAERAAAHLGFGADRVRRSRSRGSGA